MKLASLIAVTAVSAACFANGEPAPRSAQVARKARWNGSVWSGECRSWGLMREVMHEGKKQARVSLADAVRDGNVYGVGALAELAGEIFIEDGEVWVSRVVGPNRQETRKLAPGETKDHFATLLVAARVPASRQMPIERDILPSELDTFLADQIKRAGFDVRKPTPLLMVGPFVDVQGHVANGQCPNAAASNDGSAPQFTASFAEVWGRAVGVYAEDQEGVLTHHGSRVHLHFLSDGKPRLMMHADRLGLKKGSVLFLPIRERRPHVIPTGTP